MSSLLSCQLQGASSSRAVGVSYLESTYSYKAVTEQIGAVESVKAASDIYAPLAGNVEAVNEELSEQPNLLNKSPEEDGMS